MVSPVPQAQLDNVDLMAEQEQLESLELPALPAPMGSLELMVLRAHLERLEKSDPQVSQETLALLGSRVRGALTDSLDQ